MSATLELDTFFDEAVESCVAAAAGATATHDYALAGRPFRVHYANPGLARGFHPPLAHLASSDADGAAPFTVHVWGGEPANPHLPPPPWESLPYYERGGVRGYHGERHALTYDRRPGVFSAVDHAAPDRHLLDGGRRITALPGMGGALPPPAAGLASPGRTVRGARLSGRLPQGGVLLAGRTGSGKSTTAVLCLGSTLEFAGDDFMLVQPGASPRLHSLYSSAKLNQEVLDWRCDLRPAVVNADRLDTQKAVVHVAVTWPERVSTGFPLRAILLPRPTSETETIARPVTSHVAFRAMLPDTLFTVHGPPALVTRGLSELVRGVPCYELALGTDVAGVPAAIEELLGEHRGDE